MLWWLIRGVPFPLGPCRPHVTAGLSADIGADLTVSANMYLPYIVDKLCHHIGLECSAQLRKVNMECAFLCWRPAGSRLD